MKDLDSIIRDVLGNSMVAEVIYEPEVNSDDQRTMRVVIVYRGDIVAEKTIAATRAIWASFEDESIFPVVSFVSESDYRDSIAA